MTYFKPAFTTLAIVLLFLSSCSRPAIRPVQKIYITADKNVRVMTVGSKASVQLQNKSFSSHADSLNLKERYLAAKKLYKAERKTKKKAGKSSGKISNSYFVTRTKQPLAVTLTIDSTDKTAYINAHRNYARFFNMKYLFRMGDTSYAYKRWMYPKKNFINLTENGIYISRLEPVKKGTVQFTVAPGVQIFNLTSDSGKYNNAGFLGVETGIDYFYRENHFLSFKAGAVTDIIPLPFEYFGSGYINRGSAIYTSVRDNFVTGKFDLGYGLSFSRLYWTAVPYGDSTRSRKVRTTGLGLSLSANYHFKQHLKAGVVYQPNLVNIGQDDTFSYQHFIGIQAVWHFKMKKRR